MDNKQPINLRKTKERPSKKIKINTNLQPLNKTQKIYKDLNKIIIRFNKLTINDQKMEF